MPHAGRRLRVVRSRTINIQSMTRAELAAESCADVLEWRPVRRSDCQCSFRPCPYVSCKFNLYLDITKCGNLKLNFPDIEPGEMVESCVLDVSEDCGAALERVARLMNMTRERVRQIQNTALNKLSLDETCREAVR
jgi:hypothetical protein